MQKFEKIPCYIKLTGDSNIDYLLLFALNLKESNKSFVYSNYSKNRGFNETFWLTEVVDENNVCYVSTNLITFNKKYINHTEDLSFVETSINDNISDFIQTVLIPELNNYLVLDSVSQEYYIVKDEIAKQVNEESVFIINNFELTDEIKKTINDQKTSHLDQKTILKKIKNINDLGSLENEIKEYSLDKSFFQKAVKSSPQISKYIDNSLLKDNNFILKLIEINSDVFIYLPDIKKNNFDFLKLVLKNHGSLLKYVGDDIKNNKEIVLISVENIGFALQFASEILKKDIDVVTKAVSNNGSAIAYANEMFKSNIDLILLAVKNNASTLQWINKELLLDKSFVLKCAELNGRILKFLNDEFKNDIEIIIRCLKNRRDILALIPNEIKSNPKIIDIINS